MKYPAQCQRENLGIFDESTNAWAQMQRIGKLWRFCCPLAVSTNVLVQKKKPPLFSFLLGQNKIIDVCVVYAMKIPGNYTGIKNRQFLI